MKKSYVISVGGTPGSCYFVWPGDDDDDGALETTSDLALAAKFDNFKSAQAELRKCCRLYPSREFRLNFA